MNRIRAFAYVSTLALAMSFATAKVAIAQQTAANPPSANEPAELVVTGHAYQLEKAIQAKKAITVISDSVSADEIGAIPEFGFGEALQRLPGVSFIMNNGRGEAQFATLRGLNPDYNSTTIDGIALPSTEETRRQVSLDVLPSVIASRISYFKTFTADLPGDAIGGVVDLKSHSAFEHEGPFISGRADYAHWDNERQLHPKSWSGQGDILVSDTFGATNQFGALVQLSYYRRASNSLNSYTLPWSYYNPATGAALALTPGASVQGLDPVPDRHRWYFYDNIRERPGLFAKFEFDDHHAWSSHLSFGLFEHDNDEHRYSNYLNKAGTITITSPSTGSFSQGTADADYDKYNQYRRLAYLDFGVEWRFDPLSKISLQLNEGYGRYRQDTIEDVFLQGASPSLAFNYLEVVDKATLFTPIAGSTYTDPTKYAESYHLLATDQSQIELPQGRIDYSRNMSGQGWGWQFGGQYKAAQQLYKYHENRFVPIIAPSLATVGLMNGQVCPEDGQGQCLLLVDPNRTAAYVAANPLNYTTPTTQPRTNAVSNFKITEDTGAAYGEVGYRTESFYALAGLRYEHTDLDVTNYTPSPFTSLTSFVPIKASSSYGKALPTLNVSYDITPTARIKAAVTQTLARPTYSSLGSSSVPTQSSGIYTQTLANPNLKPRESTNYDVSFELYPMRGAVISVAGFYKDLKHEIVTLTSTQNVNIQGVGVQSVLVSQAQNAGSARVEGMEVNVSEASLGFLHPWLHYFGASANVTVIGMDAPVIRMSNGTFRQLPQLLESGKLTSNINVFFAWRRYSGQLAYNHTDQMPISFDTTNAVNDQWYRGLDTLDGQFRIKLWPGVAATIEGKNLTNARPEKIVGPYQNLNYSLLNNGRAYYAGVSFAF